jgi:hypothetical protein
MSQILGGRVYRGCEKFLGEGTPFFVFFAFLLTSFTKILEGGYTFIPPLPPQPSQCTMTVLNPAQPILVLSLGGKPLLNNNHFFLILTVLVVNK